MLSKSTRSHRSSPREALTLPVATDVDLGCTGFYPWCSDYPDTQTMRLFAEQVIAHVRSAN